MTLVGHDIKVCMIAPLFPPTYAGGGKQAFSLCKALANRGVDLFVITGELGSGDSESTLQESRVDGIRVYRVYRDDREGLLGALKYGLRILSLLVKKRGEYDIIHIHGIRYYPYIAIAPTRIFGKKIIAKMSLLGSDDPKSIEERPFGTLQLRTVASLDRIVSTTDEFSSIFRESGLPINKLVKISNGVDTEKFKPVSTDAKRVLRKSLGLPVDAVLVTFVGIVDSRKGIDLLVKAWKDVVGNCPDARLIVVGPRSIEESASVNEGFVSHIAAEIQAGNMEDTIVFTGFRQEIERYLQASDVFVLPSLREGQPNSLLEAMSCGLPSIVTRLPWSEEIIDNDLDGFLMRVRDTEHLSELLIKLISSSEMRHEMGASARKKAIAEFSMFETASKYMKLYQEILTSDPP